MGNFRNNVFLFIILTGSSAAIYLVQYAIFKDPTNTAYYFFQDMAFVPIQALIATLLINKFLSITEHQRKMKKINVIISTFFVETGVEIIMQLSRFDQNPGKEREIAEIEDLISNKSSAVKKTVDLFDYDFYADPEKLDELAVVMSRNRRFLLDLLGNPNLLEHESFTDMLWAVFHIADELKSRGDLKKLTEADILHLSNDMLRAYKAMTIEWIGYINYLKGEYPFLYAIAIRKSPFEAEGN